MEVGESIRGINGNKNYNKNKLLKRRTNEQINKERENEDSFIQFSIWQKIKKFGLREIVRGKVG